MSSRLKRLWVGMLTRNSPTQASTNNPIVLIVNQRGVDQLHHTFPDTPQDDQERGQANLYEVDVSTKSIVPERLNASSVRMGIRSDDIWLPEHFVVWGKRLTNKIAPLAIATDLTDVLSTDVREGNISIPPSTRQYGRGGHAD